MPELLSAISAKNAPIPAAMANFKVLGMALMIISRTLNKLNNKKMMPLKNTAPSAVCHSWPMPRTTPYVKNAFKPMPGASAIGRFAQRPIMKQPIAAAKQVATKTAPLSMPASASIAGLTNMMYAMVR